jgi:hypothetical protein
MVVGEDVTGLLLPGGRRVGQRWSTRGRRGFIPEAADQIFTGITAYMTLSFYGTGRPPVTRYDNCKIGDTLISRATRKYIGGYG